MILTRKSSFVRSFFWRALSALRSYYWRIASPITVGARCAVVDANRVLLVRHTYQDGWLIPGGGVKKGETLRDAARREIREECGIEINGDRLFQVYFNCRQGINDHVALFVATGFKGSIQIADASEIEEVAFFPFDELPSNATPATRRRVEEIKQGLPLSDRW